MLMQLLIRSLPLPCSYRERLLDNRNRMVEELMKEDPAFKPPADYRCVLRAKSQQGAVSYHGAIGGPMKEDPACKSPADYRCVLRANTKQGPGFLPWCIMRADEG